MLSWPLYKVSEMTHIPLQTCPSLLLPAKSFGLKYTTCHSPKYIKRIHCHTFALNGMKKNEWTNQRLKFCTNELCTNRNGKDTEHYHLYSKMLWRIKVEGHQRHQKYCWKFFRWQMQRILPKGSHFCNVLVLSGRQGPFPTEAPWARKGLWIQILRDLNMLTLQYPLCFPIHEREGHHPHPFSHTLKPHLERQGQLCGQFQAPLKLIKAISACEVQAPLMGIMLAHILTHWSQLLLVASITLSIPSRGRADSVNVPGSAEASSSPAERTEGCRHWLGHGEAAQLACPTEDLRFLSVQVILVKMSFWHRKSPLSLSQ